MTRAAIDADVLVAGGGPIGLATALHARAAGLRVVVVEPRTGPVDKACGEGLMPAAVEHLRRLGVAAPGRAFRGIRYLAPGHQATASFRAGPGLGVRRTALHTALAERAEAAGVEVVTGSVGEVRQDDHGVTAAGRRTRYLVAADGLHSPVRRQLGLTRPVGPMTRYGQRRHFAVRPWTDHVEVYWGERAEAYVTPVAEDLVGVAFLTGRAEGSYADLMGSFPELCARLADAVPVSQVRGAGPLRQTAASPSWGRVLLVGDAAGYVDALTGEGLAVGLATAAAAVAAMAADRPERYPAAWRSATRRYRLTAGALLSVSARPAVRRRLVPAAERLPWVFGRVVDHVS